jgi:hypothetical protein
LRLLEEKDIHSREGGGSVSSKHIQSEDVQIPLQKWYVSPELSPPHIPRSCWFSLLLPPGEIRTMRK